MMTSGLEIGFKVLRKTRGVMPKRWKFRGIDFSGGGFGIRSAA
jgi:hypothetical protein